MNKKSRSFMMFAFLMAISGGLVSAQTKPKNTLNTVRIVQVKPDKLSDFLDLQREYRDVRIAAGKPARQVWREIRGKGDVFHIVTSAKNWREFDKPLDTGMDEDQWADWDRRIRETIDSYEVHILRAFGDLKIERANEEIPPKFMALKYRTFATGYNPQYLAWLRGTFFPRMREEGATGVSVQKMEFGGNGHTWLISFYFDSWKEWGAPPPWGKMNPNEHAGFFAPARPLTAKNTALRFEPGLSNSDPEANEENAK